MSRPTSRVLALLEILQAGGTHTAAVLAGRLGVDERTVRRYVAHLVDLDVPVRAERGRYGGFRLAPGFRMPPLMLTDDEALAVMLGLAAAQRYGPAAGPAAATHSAAAKVRRVLPRRLGERLDALLETAGFTAKQRPYAAPETDVLLLFAQAARERRAVAIGYRSADGRVSRRTLHPYGLVAHAGRWYVTGADSASGEDRTFRLDRVHTADLLPDVFTLPDDDLGPRERLLTALAAAPRRYAVRVLVQADPAHLERRLPPGLAVLEPLAPRDMPAPDGPWVRLALQAEQLDWVPSLLAWIDRPFVIEEPAALRDHVRSLADRLHDCAGRQAPGADPGGATEGR
ncbi:helix-turn-helix transcriptional regulator [Actinacidiphila acididurans]|uniref:YafY family transcriptional regulator n=1 Tax=Actinacidiphila acididurans TaxID=2784346 RepID=A0ABS2TT79_9ACTN|nr:YafY family protein [Actinacidiphila acididurans]MBM9506545.1 YafY family transcriptional regulator [Actinacidiphila acididurans]